MVYLVFFLIIDFFPYYFLIRYSPRLALLKGMMTNFKILLNNDYICLFLRKILKFQQKNYLKYQNITLFST